MKYLYIKNIRNSTILIPGGGVKGHHRMRLKQLNFFFLARLNRVEIQQVYELTALFGE